jgi:hypothetical protein
LPAAETVVAVALATAADARRVTELVDRLPVLERLREQEGEEEAGESMLGLG